MKKNANWISIILVFIVLIGGVLAVNSLFTKDFKTQQKSISASGIDNIDINSDLVGIKIHPSQDGKIHANIAGKASRLADYDATISSKGQSIEIHTVEKNGGASALSLTKTIALHVYLPEKDFKKIAISTKMSSLHVNSNLHTKKLEFTSSLGNLDVQRFTGEKFTVNTGGHVRINKLSGDVNIKSNSGNIQINEWSHLLANSEIYTNKGNVQIGANKLPSSLSLDLHSNGYIETNLDITNSNTENHWKQSGINKISGSIGQKTENTPKATISSDTGKISIKQ
ncbi:DUF4097 family beta strand repeat-containing protein [Bacillus sp. C1]